jgi:hypothetical protein
VEEKTCTKCGVTKPAADFRSMARTRDGLDSQSRSCRRQKEARYRAAVPDYHIQRNQRWYAANGAKARIRAKAHYAADKDHHREMRWAKKYSLNAEQYEALLAAQQGQCAICRTSDPGKGRAYWHVDHDHRTGAVRGL